MTANLAALALLGMGICLAQGSSTITLSNGIQLEVTANLGQPTGQTMIQVEMTPASGNSYYRIFRDQNNLAVFAYEFSIGVTNSGKSLGITAKPVETAFAEKFPNADGGKPVPTLSEEMILPPLYFGREVKIGLFELEGMGLKVTDTFGAALFTGTPDELTDLTAPADRIQLSGLRLKINGIASEESGPRGAVEGRYGMFYIPDVGAFILSAAPVPGRSFVQAGTISGNTLEFSWNNESYAGAADAPILARGGNGDLWVYLDASYRPSGSWTMSLPDQDQVLGRFFAAASDSLSWWLP